MTPAFDRAHEFVAGWEGGWSDHPDDPGGLTRWGITIRTVIAKALDFNNDGAVNRQDLRDMTKEQAREVYFREYWQASGCPDLPASLALVHYDCAVNQGVGRAIRILQKSLRVSVDGIFGPQTLAAVKRSHVKPLITEYCARRAVHYSSLAIVARFGLGWFRRLFDAHATALAPASV